jgi:hypothetical protein
VPRHHPGARHAHVPRDPTLSRLAQLPRQRRRLQQRRITARRGAPPGPASAPQIERQAPPVPGMALSPAGATISTPGGPSGANASPSGTPGQGRRRGGIGLWCVRRPHAARISNTAWISNTKRAPPGRWPPSWCRRASAACSLDKIRGAPATSAPSGCSRRPHDRARHGQRSLAWQGRGRAAQHSSLMRRSKVGLRGGSLASPVAYPTIAPPLAHFDEAMALVDQQKAASSEITAHNSLMLRSPSLSRRIANRVANSYVLHDAWR